MAAVTCGARIRAGSPCKLPAGWGTEHIGTGRCKLHGGASPGAPKRNKNAVKTGEHETIWLDQLEAEEQALFERVKTDVLAQLDEEIRLVSIRERRMLQRIAALREHMMTVVEESEVHERNAAMEYDPEIDDVKAVDVVKTTKKKTGTLGQIQNIEEALTRVQAQKTRLLELKHKVESGGDQDDGSLKELVRVLRESGA